MKRKTIALPGRPDLDILPILPIIDAPIFQRLAYTKQLENAARVFVSAHHTRFEHSLGTYSLTLDRANKWRRDGAISVEDAHDLALFGLLHDVGHGPYSHATEALTGGSHHQMGLCRLKQLVNALVFCDSSVERIQRFFTGENLIAVGVTHRPLGTDKMDYLKRDARYTNNAVRFREGDLINHIDFRDGQLVIGSATMEEVAQAYDDYVYMHKQVYLKPSALNAKRFFQKIVALEMTTNAALTPEKLWSMDDLELEAALLYSRNVTVRQLFGKLRYRILPKTAIIFHPKGVVTTDRIKGKAITTFEVEPETLSRFDPFNSPVKAMELEEMVARCVGLSSEEIMVIPVVTPQRFIPDDVAVYDGSVHLGSLRELRPDHYRSLLEKARSYASVRVCVFPQYRERVAEPQLAKRVFDVLMEAVH